MPFAVTEYSHRSCKLIENSRCHTVSLRWDKPRRNSRNEAGEIQKNIDLNDGRDDMHRPCAVNRLPPTSTELLRRNYHPQIRRGNISSRVYYNTALDMRLGVILQSLNA